MNSPLKLDREMLNTVRIAALIGAIFVSGEFAAAQTDSTVAALPADTQAGYKTLINANTVTILGASLSGSYIKIVDDIANAVNDGHNLRVLPIIGEGGSQNIRDLLYLKGVDVGIVMSNSLDTYNGQPLFENLNYRLQYIARLYEEEFHVVGNVNLNSIHELEGKKVGFHGGAFASGQDLLAKLEIKPAEAVQVDFFKGLEQLKSGEIAAIIRATASPMEDLDDSFDPQSHKLISIPFPDELIESHLPAKLTSKHYPKIIPEGQVVDTAAIGVVLASYAWQPGTDRYRRVAQFTEAFFSNFDKLLANTKRHPKWDDTNLAATLPGWQRFPAAEEWLQSNTLPTASEGKTISRDQLSAFLITQGIETKNDEQLNRLLDEFQKWRQSLPPQ